jgi:hypothetical protein
MLFDPNKAVFWPTDAHFLRPVHGRYTFANLHALGNTAGPSPPVPSMCCHTAASVCGYPGTL